MRERETRAALNALETAISALGAVATVSTYVCTATQTIIPVGGLNGLSELRIEVVLLYGAAACNIESISGGTEGQLKIFIMMDSDVRFIRDLTKIALNQPASLSSFGGYAGDILGLVNIGGDGASVNGYWKEWFRTPQVY